MDLYMNILGFVHLLMFCFTASYLLFFKEKHWFDVYYILYFIFVNIHWYFLNGECLIAYLYTKYFDASYVPGNTPHANNDIINIFNAFLPTSVIHIIILVLLALYLVNVYFVLKRNSFNHIIIIIMIISYILYILSMRINLNFSQQYSVVHVIIYTIALIHYSRILYTK